MHLVWRRHNPEVDCICYSWLEKVYPWVVPSLLQTVNPVIIKNTKKIQKKYNSKLQKKYNTEQGKIINKRKIQHTLMDSRFCSLTACLKNAKNTEGQSAICEGLEKYKKNTKIQIAFLDVMEKYKKKYKKYKVYFFCILFVFFSYFFCIFTKKIQKKYECNCSKIQNTKKIRINNFKNTKKNKKIRTQNFKNTKYKETTNSKISERANPMFTFGNQEPKYKKNTKPTSCIFQTLQFWFCIFGLYFFRFFFVFLNIGRRPFCSHPGQLKCIHYYPFAHVPSHSPWLKFGSSPTDWYRVPYVWTAFGWGPWSRLCCPKRQHPVREAESCQRWFWNHLYSHKLPSWAGNYIQCAQIHQVGFSWACRNLTAVALRTGTLANLPILMPRASFGCTTEHSQPKPWKQVRHTKSTPAQAKKTAAYVFKIYVTVHFRLG